MESRAEERGRGSQQDFERVKHHFDKTGTFHEQKKKNVRERKDSENMLKK